ncbi:tetratricopeptide repeat protein [Ferrovum myxofaciens]|uniref:tetratricopeptide repeat protein n=1 Tax=Ferrovum myxofaciens TaxID=416213 RepID=UPI000A07115A|nr:tetratricopeptide repeat protein [Ferrovum myxofaciens]
MTLRFIVMIEREQIIRPWLTLILGAGILLSMAAAYQGNEAFLKTVDPFKPTGISIAYLESRLAGHPDQPAMLETLAWQYMTLGHWDAALKTAQRLEDLGGKQDRARALFIRVRVAEQRAFEYPLQSIQRAHYLGETRQLLNRTLDYHWDVPTLEYLVRMARDSSNFDVMSQDYQALAVQDPERARLWYARYGKAALDSQHYTLAAEAFFQVEGLSRSVSDKRRAWAAGIGALEAGNQVAAACVAADAHMAGMEMDPEAVATMLKLARSAQRHDLEVKYAKLLLQLSRREESIGPAVRWVHWDGPTSGSARRYFHRHGSRFSDGVPGAVLWAKSPARFHRSADQEPAINGLGVGAESGVNDEDATFARDVTPEIEQSSTQGARAPKNGGWAAPAGAHPKNLEDFELMYSAFVGNGQLKEAEAVCLKALERHLDPAVWTKRLAQVALWNGQPKVALENWMIYAQATHNEEAWQNVLRIARQTNDDRSYLTALLHESERNPEDLELIGKIIAAHERLAEPEASLDFLKARAVGSMRVPMLERYAQLAEDLGDEDKALWALHRLQADYGPSPRYAIDIADIDLQKKNPQAAFDELTQVKSRVGVDKVNAPFWRAYAEVADLSHHDQAASEGHKKLLETGGYDDDDLLDMENYYAGYPLDAGRLFELQFRLTGKLQSLLNAMGSYSTARAWGRVYALLQGLTAKQRAEFETNADFLMARGDYFLRSGHWKLALADMHQAMMLPQIGDTQRVAYLWALVDFGADDELKTVLYGWRHRIEADSIYWGVAGAAYVRLNQPERALGYLSREAKEMKDDPQWLLILSYAQEDSGDEASAWRSRRAAWSRLNALISAPLQPSSSIRNLVSRGNALQPVTPVLDMGGVESPLALRVSLSQLFVNGDASLDYLTQLLQRRRWRKRSGDSPEAAESLLGNLRAFQDVPLTTGDDCLEELDAEGLSPEAKKKVVLSERCRVSNAAKDVATSWALGGEHNDLARAWLAQEYGNRLLHSTDARITLALAENDQETLARLVDDQESKIQVDQRVESLERLGRRADAQTTAFEGGENAPNNTTRHEIEREVLLTPSDNISQNQDPSPGPYWSPQGYITPSVVAGMNVSTWSPLSYVEKSAGVGFALNNEYTLDAEAIQRTQTDLNTRQVAYVPAQDNSMVVTLGDHTDARDYAVTVGHRSAWYAFDTYSGSAQYNWSPTLKARVMAGWNQFTDLSPVIQVMGMKNMVDMSLEWLFAPRWFLKTSVEGDRFNAQNGEYLGNGLLYSMEMGYQLMSSMPNWNLRFVTYEGRFNSAGNVVLPQLATLVPRGQAVNTAFFMPGNISQYGLMTGYGTDYENNYLRPGWQPYVDAGVVNDTILGLLPQISAGLAGPIFGGDYARIYYFHETAPGSTESMTQTGVSYRYFY